ncbi:MAG: hypothetical protein IPM16_15315 [Chloroflexi bacterium]|nr:hypothetical protein [Chloroflexota bacterium]
MSRVVPALTRKVSLRPGGTISAVRLLMTINPSTPVSLDQARWPRGRPARALARPPPTPP